MLNGVYFAVFKISLTFADRNSSIVLESTILELCSSPLQYIVVITGRPISEVLLLAVGRGNPHTRF